MASIYDFLFLHAAEGILVVDEAGYLRHINPAAAAMLQRLPETVIGQPVKTVFKDQRTLLKLLNPGGGEQSDIWLPGERLAIGFAADINAERVVLLNDVTERHALESRRENLIKAISHDLRNPISAIGGYAELVAKFGEVNPQQEKFLTRIRQTTNKLYELTAKLVDLAWIEAGMPLEHIPVELASLTREAMNELSLEARRMDISILNSIPDELPAVMGDPKRLKQVVFNLLDNAIRYSLPSSNVVIHAWPQNQRVYYTIADKGIGIAEDEQEKIWDRMWRSNDERVRDISGGGIGLSFVQTIISRHGGQIEVESKLNVGSTFTFYLPLTEDN